MLMTDLFNQLAHAVGLDQLPGFEPAVPGGVVQTTMTQWIRLAEIYHLRKAVDVDLS